ncbi:MAG: arsenate reductase ArsC [Candidatus Omnitrophota bacterium]
MSKIPSLLFACIENSCRSQIAAGFAREIGKDKVTVFSAGSKPAGYVNPQAIKVMSEIGIDLSNAKSKGFYDLPKNEFDYVVTLGCKDKCPYVPAIKNINWDIPDPKAKDPSFFYAVRDIIKEKVTDLINEIERQTKSK